MLGDPTPQDITADKSVTYTADNGYYAHIWRAGGRYAAQVMRTKRGQAVAVSRIHRGGDKDKLASDIKQVCDAYQKRILWRKT